ncbi:MAG: DUF4149 domain-containing protein [Campylobacteraceae bacterium]|nr:DUF4149 domain-containing protein [Campylobacteraceae bacterium]
MNRSFLIVYITLLGITIGAELAAGAFVAPVIFHPESYLGNDVLTHFQSGILMTQVFLKTNMLLGAIALYSIFFEVIAWSTKTKKDILCLVFSLVIVPLTALFLFYYTPFIVDAQILGSAATTSDIFNKMHKESEMVMKLLMVVQISLLLRRVWLIEQKA